MKDILHDIVAHTHALGVLTLVRITSENNETHIDSITDDRTVVMNAKTHTPVPDFTGVFGMPNLEKLKLHLSNPEYKNNAKLELVSETRNGEEVPAYIHFENETGDFQNDYRFMIRTAVDDKLKNAKFKGANWDVSFEPTVAAIQRMKLMGAAHSEETVFTVKTEVTGGVADIVFYFGDASTHAGRFVFQAAVEGTLKHAWSWPVSAVQSILNLDGDKTMSISDQGAMKISVDSGMANYDYILPAQSK